MADTRQPMRMTKQQAAAEQIGHAMNLWQEGSIASAITLAGAAEESLPRSSDETLFVFLKRLGTEALQTSEKEVVSRHLNAARNWLKHDLREPEYDLGPLEGFLMIMRAYTSFLVTYGESAKTPAMLSFDYELRAAVRRLFDPLEKIARCGENWRAGNSLGQRSDQRMT